MQLIVSYIIWNRGPWAQLVIFEHRHENKSCLACWEWVNERVKEWESERVWESDLVPSFCLTFRHFFLYLGPQNNTRGGPKIASGFVLFGFSAGAQKSYYYQNIHPWGCISACLTSCQILVGAVLKKSGQKWDTFWVLFFFSSTACVWNLFFSHPKCEQNLLEHSLLEATSKGGGANFGGLTFSFFHILGGKK